MGAVDNKTCDRKVRSIYYKKNMSYLISKVVISSLLWAYVMAAPVEDQADNRIIGYGLTDTGKTVLSGILIATLGLAWYSAGGNSPFKSRRRQFSLQKRRQQASENCHTEPDLPECVDALSKGRFIQKRRKFR